MTKYLKLITKRILPKFRLNEDKEYNSFWDIIRFHKFGHSINLFVLVIDSVYGVLLPIFLAYIYSFNNLYLAILALGIYMSIHSFIGFFSSYINTPFTGNIFNSLGLQANKFFLSTDPIYHSNKSSGTMIAKTNRLMKSTERLSDDINYNLIPKITSAFVAIFYSFSISFVLGFWTVVIILGLMFNSLYIQNLIIRPLNKEFIEAEDDVSKDIVRTLSGFNLIRASFATDFVYNESKSVFNSMKTQFNMYHFARTIIWFFIRQLSAFASLILVYFLYKLYLDNQISLASLLASTFVSFDAINNVKGLGRVYDSVLRSYLNIKDYFDFKNNFGKQSYKVLK